MSDLATAYRRSAFPRLGISLQRASTEPALLATLTLLDSIHQRTEKRARINRAGRYLEASSQ